MVDVKYFDMLLTSGTPLAITFSSNTPLYPTVEYKRRDFLLNFQEAGFPKTLYIFANLLAKILL